jgi:hypothetical protein
LPRRSRGTERSFVSLGLDPHSEPDPAKTPLTASPNGEGGAFPFQMPNALRGEHIMKKPFLAAMVGVILVAFGVLSADAQDLKAMLLKPTNGWVIEWFNPLSLNKGVNEAVFEDRGGKVVAKLNIVDEGAAPTALRICESDVMLTADTVGFDGCRDSKIVLTFDPGDNVYPLKAKSGSANGYLYKAKAK